MRATGPYVGLDYFVEEDAAFFFGRDAERKRIIGNLKASRLTLLYAESGVGKSSLLRAGVAARLRELAARSLAEQGSARYFPVVFSSWRGDSKAASIGALEDAVRSLLGEDGEIAIRRDSLEHAIEDAVTAAGATPLVILDQFEEHFLYEPRNEEGFDDELAGCINRHDLPVHFLISVREDAYSLIGDRFKARIPNVYGNYLHLEFLDERAARGSVLEPVHVFNEDLPEGAPRFSVESELVDAVLEQVRRGQVTIGEDGGREVTPAGPDPVETAYLQLVMKRLWDKEVEGGSHQLRLKTLQDLGGANTIVRRHLDDAMDKLPVDERDAAADAFRFLVTSGGRKIAFSAHELREFTDAPTGPLEPALEHLEHERILRPIPSEPDGVLRREIYHDVLAPAILDWRRRHVEKRRREEARERERLKEREERLRRWRLAVLIIGSVVVAVIAVMGIIALHERGEARKQSQVAASRELAATARSQVGTDPELSNLLAREALRRRRTGEAVGALRAALAADRSLGVLSGGIEPVRDLDTTTDGKRLLAFGDDGHVRVWSLEDHKRLLDVPATASPVESARFSPDGRRILSAGGDGSIVVWDAADGRRLLTLRRRGPRATRVQWAADGRRILAATMRDVTVWSAGGRRLRTLDSPGGPIVTAQWQPDGGEHIATAGRHGTVWLWDWRSGSIVAQRDTGSPLRDAIFNDRGTAIVTVGAKNSTATVWDLASGRTLVLRHPAPPGAPLLDATFDHSGRRVATAGVDHHVWIWDARTGATKAILTGHGSYVTAIAFGPDDSTVATASNDRSARTWDAATGEPLSVLRGHDSWISGLAFPRADVIATAGAEGDVRLWRTSETQLASFTARGLPDSVSFSRDGARVVTATTRGVELRPSRPGAGQTAFIPVHGGINTASLSPDGRLVVVAAAWEERPSAPARVLHVPDGETSRRPLAAGPGNGAVTAAFSPDGRVIVSAHRDGAARLWSSRSHRLLRRLGPARRPSDQATLLDAQFSHDGRRVATVGATGTARVFDTASGRELTSVSVPKGALDALRLNAAAFQPGGGILATGGQDALALLWDLKTSKARPLPHDDIVTSVAFSPDGAIVATASWDGTTRLWDARIAQPLGVLARDPEGVLSVAFSPDGRRLVTGAASGVVRVWNCRICGSVTDLERSARNRVSRRLTPEERRAYLGDTNG